MGAKPGFPSFPGADTSKTAGSGGPLNTAKPYGSTPLETDKFSTYNLNDFTKKFYDTDKTINPSSGYNIYVPTAGLDQDAAAVKKNTALYRKISQSLFTYDDKNNNNKYDKDVDEYIGKYLDLRIFMSVDGAWLLETAKSLEPTLQSNELVLFLEVSDKDHDDRISSTVFLCRGGVAAATYFKNKALTEAIGKYMTLPKEQLEKLIKNCADKYAFTDALRWLINGVAEIAGWLPEKTGKLLCDFGEVLEHLKVSKDIWDADLQTPVSKFFEQKRAQVENLQNTILESSFMKTLDAAGVGLVKTLVKGLKTIFKGVLYALDEIIKAVLTLGQGAFALLCGAFNGILDMVGGLLIFIGWILRLIGKAIEEVGRVGSQADYYIPLLLEYLDNGIQAMQQVDWGEVFDAVKNGLKKFWDAIDIEEILSHIQLSRNELFYYTGYIAINILACCVGVGEVAALTKIKALEGPLQEAIEVISRIVDRLPVVAKVTIEGVFGLVKGYVKLLMEGTKSIIALINKIFEALLKWILGLVKKGGQLAGEVLEHFNVKYVSDAFEEGVFRSKLARVVAAVYDDAPRVLKEIEEKIATLKYENASICKDGKVELELITSGLERRVVFTEAQLKRMKNAIVTHNHPLGGSLSPADIELFLESGLKEIRARCPDGSVFSLKNKGFKMSSRERERFLKMIKEFMDENYKNVSSEYADALQKLRADQMIKELKNKFGDKIDYIHFQTQ